MKTINKRWFKNRLAEGKFLVKCTGIYSDDYAFDNASNFSIETEFRSPRKEEFTEWYIDTSRITGEKEGIIKLSFASCQYYEFKLKQA